MQSDEGRYMRQRGKHFRGEVQSCRGRRHCPGNFRVDRLVSLQILRSPLAAKVRRQREHPPCKGIDIALQRNKSRAVGTDRLDGYRDAVDRRPGPDLASCDRDARNK